MSQVRCGACGTENPAGSVYCSQCARRLDDETSQRIEAQRSTAVATQTTTVRWVAIMIVVVAVAILVVLIAVLLVR